MPRSLVTAIFFFLVGCLAQQSSAFEVGGRWGTTATNSGTGAQGTPITLTWSFVEDGTSTPSGDSELISFLDTEFGAGPGGSDYSQRPWFLPFQESFDRLSELAGLTYIYQPLDDGADVSGSSAGKLTGSSARGDVRIAGIPLEEGSSTLAFNYFPDFGDMVFNTNVQNFDNANDNYRFLRNTTMHEAMHGVGISHVESSNANFLIEPALSTAFDGPQLDDLLALHRNYGDVLEKNGGNNSAGSATPLGLIARDMPGVIGAGGSGTTISGSETDFVSIDDNSDTDFFTFSINSTSEVTLELLPKGAVYQVGPQDGTQTTFNAVALSDLSMFLFDSSFNQVGVGNSNPAGSGERIITQLDPGTYYARVAGAADNVQLYQLSVATAGAALNLVWTGEFGASWSEGGQANFSASGSSTSFAALDNVRFDDTASRFIVGLLGSLNAGEIVFDATNNYTLQGSGSITGGSITLDGPGTVVLATSGNSYSGDTLVNDGTLKLTGNIEAMQTAVTVADGGTVVMRPSVAGSTGISFDIQPGGELHVGEQGVASSADVFPDSPAGIINNGLVRVFGSESITNVTGSGAVTIEENSAILREGNTFAGQLTVFDGALAVVEHDQALGSNLGGTVVESGGSLQVNANVTLRDDLELAGAGNPLSAGALHVSSSVVAEFAGAVSPTGFSATIRVATGGSADFAGNIDSSGVGTELVFDATGSINTFGSVQLGSGGMKKLAAGTLNLAGPFESGGPVQLEEGHTVLSGSGDLTGLVEVGPAAVLTLDGTHLWEATSVLAGSGIVSGDLATDGTIAPGANASEVEAVADSIGLLTLTDDLALAATSVLELEIGGTDLSEFDQLVIDGMVTLGGYLSIELVDLGGGIFQPELGDSFQLVRALGGAAGMFETFDLPALDAGLGWTLNAGANAISLDVVSTTLLEADFDSSGAVDGLDLVSWQAGFGILADGTRADGDATNDGAVSGSDFLVWQQQFQGDGIAFATSIAVPEPSSALLAVCAALLIVRCRVVGSRN